MRKNFGPTKYPRKIVEPTRYPVQKILDPQNTHEIPGVGLKKTGMPPFK